MQISDWLYDTTGQTHQIAYNRLLELVYNAAVAKQLANQSILRTALALDCKNNGDAHPPRWLREYMPDNKIVSKARKNATPSRQSRHLSH